MTVDNQNQSFWDRISQDYNDFENSVDTRVRACLGMEGRSPSSSAHDYGAVVYDGSSAMTKSINKKESRYSVFTISPHFYSIVIAFLISGLIIYGGLRRFNFVSGICFVVLGLVIYLLMASMTGSNIAGSLNDSIYPYAPNLGADGVSTDVRFSARNEW